MYSLDKLLEYWICDTEPNNKKDRSIVACASNTVYDYDTLII